MPKVVPNIEKRILDVAKEAFEKNGFSNTDIRSIASDAGVSVGSVYAKFKSKGELFLKVAQEWHQVMEQDIQNVFERITDDKERLCHLAELLITALSKRGGLWREFFMDSEGKTQVAHLDRFIRAMEKDWKKLARELEASIVRASKMEKIRSLASKFPGRLSLVFRAIVFDLAFGFPNQTKKNIAFVKEFLGVFL